MPFVRNNNKHIAYKEYEPPAKKLISEGDILIKNLAEKQRNPVINLQEYLQKEPNFQKLAEHISATSCCSGVLPVEQFKIALKQLEEIEDLRVCNLSNDDVKLILDYRDGRIHKYKNVEPHILQIRIENILEMIKTFKENSQNKSVHNKNEISHKKNEALVLKPDSTETKLLKFAMQNKTSEEKFPHPMDNLKIIENNLISRLSEETLMPSKIQKRIRRQANKLSSLASVDTSCIITGDLKREDREIHPFVKESKWDVKDENNITLKCIAKLYTCKQQNFYTVKNGKIVKLNQNEITKKVNIEMENRMSVEEIKTISKFKNYDVGLPSRVLYLKNLPKHANESDLNELFSKFMSNNLMSFRVMTGKMRGQAFVTFPDVNTAMQALNLTNGVLLDGKPVVMEFGKNNSESNMQETIT